MRFIPPWFALGVLAITGSARAATLPAALQIEWEAPDGCPDQSAFETELANQLAPEAQNLREPLTVSVRIEHTESRFELRISTPVGEREPLADADCAVLVRTAALIVGMAVEVSAATEPEPTEDSKDTKQEQDFERPEGGFVFESPPEVAEGAPVEVVEQRPPVYLAVRANVGGDLGILPNPAPSAGIAMAMGRERFRLEATLASSLAQPAATEIDPGVGAELALTVIGVRGCYVIKPGELSGSLCAGGEIGRFRIDAFGTLPGLDLEKDARWWALSGSASVARQLIGPLSFAAEVGLVGRPINRNRFTAVPVGDQPGVEIHTVPPISARVMSGVEVRFR